ncbi:hypothetical protein Patl1_13924 [Pistacia atlantica]|uniref:Uncharacterized protein n=1 Tax=Pistacia atlantica TaxID=434234 RepID=A0ACC1AY12_9ROSI|nr:hypothetical protein Patl1_13924 [Pistacia atlantica]
MLNLLGEVDAGMLPVSFHEILNSALVEKGFVVSWCTEVSCSLDEVVSKLKVSDISGY